MSFIFMNNRLMNSTVKLLQSLQLPVLKVMIIHNVERTVNTILDRIGNCRITLGHIMT